MRTYFLVPYADRSYAKAAGLWWDPARKCWYRDHDKPGIKGDTSRWKRVPVPEPAGKIWNDELHKFV